MATSDLETRMKDYEAVSSGQRLMPLLPALARLDGKTFHSLTRNMGRPFDPRFSALMQDACGHLVQETGARCGYTQSDEITLAWFSTDPKSQIWFDGRVAKMTSILAAECSVYFNTRFAEHFGGPPPFPALFDCRVWNVPTREEAANVFLWREQDATRNSVSMAAQSAYSHKELFCVPTNRMQEILFQKGINWNEYPDHFKRGSYFQRRTVKRKFTAEEMEALPPLHEARKNPDLEVERTEVRRLEMPPLGKVTNRPAVLLDGAEPVSG